MPFVTLPTVPLTTPLKRAFSIMREAARSAVVAPTQAQGYFLYSAADVVIADAEGRAHTLQELPPTEVLHVPHRADFLVGAAGALPLDYQQLEKALDRAGHKFAILANVQNTALVMTRNESGAAPYEPVPTSCYCTVDKAAVPAPPGVDHGQCPHVHDHGASVRCMVQAKRPADQ
jgi:hypothetical protein